MNPNSVPLISFILQTTEDMVLKNSRGSAFDFCRALCRTSSRSVVQQNQYRNSEDKYCFGVDSIPSSLLATYSVNNLKDDSLHQTLDYTTQGIQFKEGKEENSYLMSDSRIAWLDPISGVKVTVTSGSSSHFSLTSLMIQKYLVLLCYFFLYLFVPFSLFSSTKPQEL